MDIYDCLLSFKGKYKPSYVSGYNNVKNVVFTENSVNCFDINEDDVQYSVKCCLDNKKMIVRVFRKNKWHVEKKSETNYCEKDIIDYSEKGERWEGPTLDHHAYGFGCLYNGDNNIVYEGFMFNNQKVGFGIEYYPEGNQIMYYGSFLNNTRCGYGILYDKKNEIVYEGDWINGNSDNNKWYSNPMDITNEYEFHSLIQELRVGAHKEVINNEVIQNYNCSQFNRGTKTELSITKLKLVDFMNLEKIDIGICCFLETSIFVVEHCPKLESIDIDAISFCLLIPDEDEEDISSKLNKNAIFSVTNCEKLERINIGDGCFFGNAGEFELKSSSLQISCYLDLPSLKSLTIVGEKLYCFYGVNDFILDGLNLFLSFK